MKAVILDMYGVILKDSGNLQICWQAGKNIRSHNIKKSSNHQPGISFK